MQVEVYSAAQSSVASAHLMIWITVAFTAAVAGVAVWRFKARGLWIAAAGALIVPALSGVVVGGSELPTSYEYVSDVLVPLASTTGLVSAALGSLAGWLAGWLTARH